jgi:hypothetical protein
MRRFEAKRVVAPAGAAKRGASARPFIAGCILELAERMPDVNCRETNDRRCPEQNGKRRPQQA